jgi:spore coat polysaccharide biosynthesis predicted glycosyltransferase SpsG
LTTLVIKELLKLPHHSKIDVILGACFRHFEPLNRVLEEYKANNKIICVHKDVANVAELMFKADLVIASPGLSAFEALCVRTPILVIPQDLLQREEFQGRIMLIDKENIASLLVQIENMSFTYPNQEDIINMHIGEGTEEIVKAILEDDIDL